MKAPRRFLALVLIALASFVPATSYAIVFNITEDHATGGLGAGPFGTVTVTQSGANVDVVVALASGFAFVKSGAADFQNFKFNGVGVALGDITVDAHVPALVAATGAFNGNGTGPFTFGINAPSAANGSAGAFSTPISFHVANATIADLTAPNSLQFLFVADLLGPTGNTGPAGVSGVPDGGASLMLLGGALAALALVRRLSKV